MSSSTSTSPSTSSSGAIGFIGLGIMGIGMAERLITQNIAGSTNSNKKLIIWNRTKQKAEDLLTKYDSPTNIEIKNTPREVVEASDITYSMLSTPDVSRLVFDGVDGVLAGVSKGKSIVDCATLAESDMKRMNDAVVAKGGRFLEAPVSGSKVPAANGTLIFLCAGSKELFDEIVHNELAAMGKKSHFFHTDVGYGTRAKLVVNSLMGTMVAAFGEGLALSEELGLDGLKMIEVIGQGAIQSPVFALKGPKMLQGDHTPNFPLKHAYKDMVLASKMAKGVGIEYSVMNQATTLFQKANENDDDNLAENDFSAIYEQIKKESKKN